MVKWLPLVFINLLGLFLGSEGFYRGLAFSILFVLSSELLPRFNVNPQIAVISYAVGMAMGFTFFMYWQHAIIFGLYFGLNVSMIFTTRQK